MLQKSQLSTAKITIGKDFFRRTTCRLCEGSDLALVLQLTPTPPVDAYISTKRHQDAYPLDLFLCCDCGHVQLLDVVNPKLLFGEYIYETSSSPGLVEHFRKYSEEVLKFVKLQAHSRIIEIGSNDGTLLRFFKDRGMQVLGIDPAREIAERATQAGLPTIPAFFTSDVAHKIKREHGTAAIICANNVFAHADDLGDMAEGVRELLAPDGVFVFEVSYLLDMIENIVFDFIYHEHLCHHSVKPLQKFLRKRGMELIDVVRIPTKGGSIRVFAQLMGGPHPISPIVGKLIEHETQIGLDRKEIFKSYSKKIEEIKNKIIALIEKLTSQGKKISGYGASATGTVLIYHFKLGDILNFIIDDNPFRQNRFSPGHHIPVLSSKAIYDQKPDYIFILAWRFADMIIENHKAYLDQGGHFIIPLPEIREV